jgi:hypothetical protein
VSRIAGKKRADKALPQKQINRLFLAIATEAMAIVE